MTEKGIIDENKTLIILITLLINFPTSTLKSMYILVIIITIFENYYYY